MTALRLWGCRRWLRWNILRFLGSESLTLELQMLVHELVETELVPLVHARHPGSQGGFSL